MSERVRERYMNEEKKDIDKGRERKREREREREKRGQER